METGTNRHQPMRRPLVALAAAMVAGAWAAGKISAPAWAGLFVALVLAAVAVATRRFVEGQFRYLFYMLAFASAGWSAGQSAAPESGRSGGLVEKPQAGVLKARALGGNDWLQGGFRLEVEALAFGPPGRLGPTSARRLLVRVFESDTKRCPVVLPGDVLLLDGRLSPLRGYRNPGGFDRRSFLLHRGISGEFRVRDCQRILIRRPSPLSIKSATESLRQDAARMFLSSGGNRAGGLVAAMTLGLRGLVSPEDSRLFSSAGMAHLLAVSGLHVGMIALGGFLALSWLLLRFNLLARRYRTSRIAAAITVPTCIFYALLAGAGYPAVRAATVASAFLLAHALGRRTDALNLLALAAMVVVAIWPNSIYSPSFQLSFTAALGLVLLVPRASRLLRAPVGGTGELPLRSRLYRRLVQAACVTVIAWAITAPLGLYHFNQLSLTGPLVNLVAVPLAAWLVVPLGLVAVVLLTAWPAAAVAVASVASGAAGWLLGVAEISKALPALWLPSPPAITVAGIYLAVLLALGPGRRRRLFAAAIAAGALAAWPVAISSRHDEGALQVTFLDVGQGDSALVRFPGGYTLLVDTGPGWAGGASAAGEIARTLWWHGVLRLDAMAITHPQRDHAGGVGELARLFEPLEVWMAHAPTTYGHMLDLTNVTGGTGRVKVLASGDVPYQHGECSVEVLWPPAEKPAGLDVNETSLVLRAGCWGKWVLLPGDLEGDGERMLLRSGHDLYAGIVKIGHHGSRNATSEEFIEATGMKEAVISAGAWNSYGFPHRELLQRLEAAGIRTWRTDRCGAITATMTRTGTTMTPFVEGCAEQ